MECSLQITRQVFWMWTFICSLAEHKSVLIVNTNIQKCSHSEHKTVHLLYLLLEQFCVHFLQCSLVNNVHLMSVHYAINNNKRHCDHFFDSLIPDANPTLPMPSLAYQSSVCRVPLSDICHSMSTWWTLCRCSKPGGHLMKLVVYSDHLHK